jgi:hypothetical protein
MKRNYLKRFLLYTRKFILTNLKILIFMFICNENKNLKVKNHISIYFL